MNDRIDSVVDRLEAIAEELADLALESLHEAVATKSRDRPELERQLTRARRAVEKAVHVLRGDPGD
jgi:hypothetical protein